MRSEKYTILDAYGKAQRKSAQSHQR